MGWRHGLRLCLENVIVGLLGVVWFALFAFFRWLDGLDGVSDSFRLFSVFISAVMVGDCIGFEIQRVRFRHLAGLLLMTGAYFVGVAYYFSGTPYFNEKGPLLLLTVVASSIVSGLLRDRLHGKGW